LTGNRVNIYDNKFIKTIIGGKKVIKFATWILLPVMLILLSCSLQPGDSSEGVIWQKNLKYPPSAGIEIHSDNLYFADVSGAIYSCWIDTGFINWKRQLKREDIRMIFITDSGLGVISKKIRAKTSIYRIFSFDRGISIMETNLPQNIRDSYSSDNGKIIVHSQSGAVVISGDGRDLEVLDLSKYSRNIASFALWGGSYYAVEGNSKIMRFDPSFHSTGSFRAFTGTFTGNAVYDSGRIYISTSEGIKILNTVSWKAESASNDFQDLSKRVLFDGAASGIVKKNAGPGERYLLFSDLSFRMPPGSSSYSPVLHSDTLGIAAFINTKGFINIVDSRTGYYVYSKFIGMIERPYLKIPSDYNSKSVFIPLSSPAKIFCYSLKFAASQKMPR